MSFPKVAALYINDLTVQVSPDMMNVPVRRDMPIFDLTSTVS